MPIKKSAKKYMRVTEGKTQKNNKIKGQFRSAIKTTREAISKGELEKAKEFFKKSVKTLDKAAQKKVLNKNTVARMKSRFNKQIKALGEK
jgi:small subunit ribosomal protein S20